MSFLYSCGVGLIIGLIITPFIDLSDNIILLFDKNALVFVRDRYEPFRVALYASLLGSFIAFIIARIDLFKKQN